MRINPPSIRHAFCCVLMVACVPAPALGNSNQHPIQDWKIIHNPATPRDGVLQIELEEKWRTGSADSDLVFGLVTEVLADAEGRIYVLDSQLSCVQVFAPDGL